MPFFCLIFAEGQSIPESSTRRLLASPIDIGLTLFTSPSEMNERSYMTWPPGPNNKTSLFITYECLKQATVFVPDKSFQLSLMFVSKARAYPSEAPASFFKSANNRSGRQGLLVTNPLAYSTSSSAMKKKAFYYDHQPGANATKLLTSVTYEFS